MSELNEFRILVVDDNPAIHQDFKKILVNHESCDDLNQLEQQLFGANAQRPTVVPVYEVDSAFQGTEGAEKVARAIDENRPYSLAFVDMRMPPGIC